MNENLEGQLGANNEIRTYSTETIANEIQIFQPYGKYKAFIFFSSKLHKKAQFLTCRKNNSNCFFGGSIRHLIECFIC